LAFSVLKLSLQHYSDATYSSDIGVLENVQAITHAVQAKVIKQHNTAVTVNCKSVHP